FSSWTLKRVRCWTVLRYRRWALDEPTWTMTVLSILSEMTVPRRILRRPREVLVVGCCVAVSVIQPPPSFYGRAWASALLLPRLPAVGPPHPPLTRRPPRQAGR